MVRIPRILFFALLLALAACNPEQNERYSPTETATAVINKNPLETDTPTLVPAPEALEIPAEIVEWVKQKAIPFETALPGNGCKDLQPLMEMIGEARVVALGEATHINSEFFTMKHRVLECLVLEKGFNLFVMEANGPEAETVNEYVLTGVGNPEAALRDMQVWIWNTAEVLNMIEWMRQHNAAPGDAPVVNFHGMDMQLAEKAVYDLQSYVSHVDNSSTLIVQEALACYLSTINTQTPYAAADAEAKTRCRAGIQTVHNLISENQGAYTSASSAEEYQRSLQAARLLLQHEHASSQAIPGEMLALRDIYMAENAAWLLEQAGPEAKMVIWAHNGHVKAEPDVLTEDHPLLGLPVGYEAKPMGFHLRNTFGNELVIIGFSFYNANFTYYRDSATGTYSAPGSYPVGPLLPNSHEAYLIKAGWSQYFLDLRTTSDDERLNNWFQQARWLRTIGAAYDPNDIDGSSVWTVLPNAFDILIFFEQISPSHSLTN